MEKYAWSGRIVEGKKAEYVKRHDEIWPEMKELLTKAGINLAYRFSLRRYREK